ncbi:microcystin degradation protein MlrC [Nibricoccus aquaticus]|uniref:Microcystin degradation protein MlrC n=1 Tax=Nibricoccus aquaticus TaxID=2576891 RepID=A0A290QNC0_9BACT|nr:M81 family metallopeptidase [Nibricoccus aquaticus]ATC65792.1 microcystin degradation protein MlrC [Nibricoccus aquaticus]
MKPRILYAGLFHETHSFVDGSTRWSDFQVLRGKAIFSKLGDASVTDGFLEEAKSLGLEVIPTIDAWALPGGMVQDDAFEQFWREFETQALPALIYGIEGIFLVLHGAMATPTHPDPEGELLARIRALPGAAKLPVFGVLDLHANVTALMCRHANGLVCYRENPHTDAKQAGQRATQLLARSLREKMIPHMSWGRPHLMWSPPATGTADDPMLSLKRFARKVEEENPDIWVCNVAAGFSFSDTPDTGVSFSLISISDKDDDRRYLQQAAELAWSLRERGNQVLPPVNAVVETLSREIIAGKMGGPVLLVEPSDNIGGGAPGDGTGVLRALIKQGIEGGLLAINDPLTVASLTDAPTGSTHQLNVGGRGSKLDEGPVLLEATLISRSDGRFDVEDPQSHLVAMGGSRFEMGPCAVIRSGGITILLTSRKTPPFDLGQFRSQGLDPAAFAVIGVKAAVAHRRAYDKIARASYYVDTPGPCTGNLARLPWAKLRRPVWPVDAVETLSCEFT